MKTRIICGAALALALPLSAGVASVVAPVSALAVQSNSVVGDEDILVEGNFRYFVNEDGGATVAGLVDEEVENLVIPEELGGHTVTAVGRNAFSKDRTICSISMPDTIVLIDEGAFAQCEGLESVQLSKSLSVLSSYSFSGCSALTKIAVPSGVRAIGYGAFQSCAALSSVELSEGLEYIGGRGFADCASLPGISLPSTLKEIGEHAFWCNYTLASVYIPDGVESVHSNAFYGCSALRSVRVPSSVRTIDCSAFDGTSNDCVLTVQTQWHYDQLAKGYDRVNYPEVVFEEGYPCKIEAIVLSDQELTIDLGFSAEIVATTLPVAAIDSEIVWSSSDPSVAKVSSWENTASISSYSSGTATITATVDGVSASCEVTVIDFDSRTIRDNENPFICIASMPIGSHVEWVVDDPSILRIVETFTADNDLYRGSTATVAPMKAGTTTLRCLADGKAAYINEVTVEPGGARSLNKVVISGIGARYGLVQGGVKPIPVLTDQGIPLEEGVDYKLSYLNNDKLGYGTVVITGIGRYTGTVTKTFEIVEDGPAVDPAPDDDTKPGDDGDEPSGQAVDISSGSVSGLEKSYELMPGGVTPRPTVAVGGKTLTEGVDYVTIYRGNTQVGTATLDIFGIGAYGGAISTTFQITEPVAPSPDVHFGDWYYTAVKWAKREGVMMGYGDGSGPFGPGDQLTRGQLAQVLWNYSGRPSAGSTADQFFADCPAGAFYSEAVAWCEDLGYMGGYSSSAFGPDDRVTREQLATVLWRMAGSPDVEANLGEFADGDKVSDFARDAVEWAVASGVLTGYQDGSRLLGPTDSLDRAQCVTMFYRLFGQE